MSTLDALRHAAQSELVASRRDIHFGRAGWAQLPADLVAAAADSTAPGWLDGGLTARVRRVRRGDGSVALKKAREACLVQNADGQLSFVNELLRRQELDELARAGKPIAGVTPTWYASLQDGVIVSPWIDGGLVDDWDERRLVQLFDTGAALIAQGFFEWDFSPGNVMDDGRQVWLFDFGYMYRFDPLRQLNTAGTGVEQMQFHLAERIETRNLFGWLLRREQADGADAALSVFRLEKQVALQTYERLGRDLADRGANELVRRQYTQLVARWREGLVGDLGALYLAEGWRSHEADLDDDLRGQTCTPMTLRRAQWLIAHAQSHFDALAAQGALSADVVARGRAHLVDELHEQLERAQRFQIDKTPSALAGTARAAPLL